MQSIRIDQNSGVYMELGTFSVSLTVNDLTASKAFYEKLGFKEIAGNATQNWLVMKNGQSIIGLFKGMLEQNILTFNPGWDQDGNTVAQFTDVRDIQKELKNHGLPFISEVDENTTGPAHFIVADPDGNQIMIDQHV